MFVEVLLDIPVDQTFTYRVSGHETYPPTFGKRVIVPFGRGELLRTGIVVNVKEDLEEDLPNVKEVFDFPDPFPIVTKEQVELSRWIASYYCSSVGQVLFRFIPEAFKVEESVLISLKGNFDAKLTPNEKLIVNELKGSSKGSLKLSTLRRRLKLKSLNSMIRNLIKKGVIEKITYIERDKVPKEAYLRFISFDYKGKRGLELLKVLFKEKELPLKKIRELGFSKQVIDRLIDKGCVELVLKESFISNRELPLKESYDVRLTSSQREVLNSILKGDRNHLLAGVTGSGKMEIYLALAKEYVERGKGVLILVPELLLTPELQSKVEAYFGKGIGVYHGKLTPREKASTWLKAIKGEVKVFLGTRVSVLLPIKDLGLIVVDEEQDSSYKDNQKPYYNARDVAVKRAEDLGIKLVLVSATPSVKAVYLSNLRKFEKHFLSKRFSSIPPPKIEVVDLSKEDRKGLFSKKLISTLRRVVEGGSQALLYIPRRGFFSTVFCQSCGWIAECKYCKVNLTYHKSMNLLICHICGRKYRPIFRCPKCNSKLSFKGYGTERVEEELLEILPDIEVVRLDLDTVKDPVKGARLLKEIKEGRYQVIVGTNIAIKGHNFPKLSFVGVLLAEFLSGAPDFMSSERIFQSILQATGRAGRFCPGSAIVQTFNPDLPAIKYAVNYQYEEFYREELMGRELLKYPPFTLGVLLEFQIDKKILEKELKERYNQLKLKLERVFNFPKLNPAPIPKLSGRYRYISYLTTDWESHITKLRELKKCLEELFPSKKFMYKIDVEPMRIL